MDKKPKYKPFPKTKRGQYKVVDVAKIREMYLAGPDITLKKFLERNGYNPRITVQQWVDDVNLSEWKSAWLKKECDIQDEDAVPSMLEARALVSKQRANFILDWNNRAKAMKKMLDHQLNTHMEDMRWDLTHTLEIQAGNTRRRCTLDAAEMNTMAGCAQRLQDLEAKSLLLLPVNFKEVEKKNEEGNDEIPELEIHNMGDAGMKPAEITELMATYFDQFEKPKPKELEALPIEPESTEA